MADTREQRRQAGVHFPLAGERRSTSTTAREVFADAVRGADPQLAERIAGARSWRRDYARHLRAVTELEAGTTTAALAVAADGLASLHRRFVYAGADGDVPLEEVVGKDPARELATVVVRGEGRPVRELAVPYRGELLRGDALARALADWVDRGVVEPSFAAAVTQVAANPDWLALEGETVALLGAGAEMGPLEPLSCWGARLMAVDLPRPAVWSRILPAVRAGCGSVAVAVRSGREGDDLESAAGADLLTQPAAVRAWLEAAPGRLVVGNYVYADGALFARLAMAVDAVLASLLARRDGVALAYLATPTDVFAVPPEAVAAAQAAYAAGWRAPVRAAVRTVSAGRAFAPNYAGVLDTEGGPVGVTDALVTQQGPNYALAKRVQRWRAVNARAAGTLTSAHVAPPTRTASVVKNRILAAAYRGAPRFGVEVFEPATAHTLMAAVLVHDLRNPAAAAVPAVPLDHPHRLFMAAANHGGLWRQPYDPRSVLPVAAVLGLAGR